MSASVLQAFALYLAAKATLANVVLGIGSGELGLELVLAVAALIGLGRRSPWGSVALAATFAIKVLASFPHTLNHAWFELACALVLMRVALAPRDSRVRAAVRGRLVLQFAILSVFIYSGIQKLAHGQFASGEYLLRTALLEQGDMATVLRPAFECFGTLPSIPGVPMAAEPLAVVLPADVRLVARAASVMIIAAEIVIPGLVVLRVPGARPMLLAAQIGIGIVSGELSFACTATAAVLLLWLRPPRLAWVGAFIGWTLLAVVMWSA